MRGTRRPDDHTLTAPSLRDQAMRVLRARIIAGELVPERLYAIGQVAEELGVSATPVREALLDLTKDGLIEMARNRGFRVRVMTEHDLDEIVELRRMIEVPAVRAITERGLVTDAAELRELTAAIEKSAAAGDWVAFLDNDRAFHLGLLAYLGNQRLLQIAGSLRDQSRLYGLDRIAGSDSLLASTREHDLLLDAVVTSCADEAARIMDQHLHHARGIWAGRRETQGQIE
jgi:DNA-binding GntR family transcriptional regulator